MIYLVAKTHIALQFITRQDLQGSIRRLNTSGYNNSFLENPISEDWRRITGRLPNKIGYYNAIPVYLDDSMEDDIIIVDKSEPYKIKLEDLAKL